MAPEQAVGKSVDRGADIWAFGVVMFEMLSGKRLYSGDTAAETLANVIAKEPLLNDLPSSTSPRIRRARTLSHQRPEALSQGHRRSPHRH